MSSGWYCIKETYCLSSTNGCSYKIIFHIIFVEYCSKVIDRSFSNEKVFFMRNDSRKKTFTSIL